MRVQRTPTPVIGLITVVAILAAASPAAAAPGEIFAEISARPAFTSWNTLGHAWVCIAHHLNSGVKEDCYGFYPSNALDEGVVGGSDLANEFKKNPTKFGEATASLRKKISVRQYRSFQSLVSDYNRRQWKLTSDNCQDFAIESAKRFNWNTPSRKTLPATWVAELAAAN